MKVVDNFLPIFEFEPIKDKMESIDFPWYWQEHSHGYFTDGKFVGDNVPQFIHRFVDDGNPNSNYYYLFKCSSCLLKLNVDFVTRLKANSNSSPSNQFISPFILVWFINSCNLSICS